MKELTVFDIQRFALHDGPGIRTTVFLKGCPLDCLWCHNPESKKMSPQLGFLEKQCTLCGKCAHVCEHSVHKITKEGRHIINYKNCIQCGRCVEQCVNRALKIYGRKMQVDEILKLVEKDMDFYQKSGGGLTVSGGEPMLQFAALLELLKEAKEKNIHVCLDTCGQAAQTHYAEIAKYVDVFLFDYKLTDPEKHKECTGTDNNLILSNLEYLCGHGSKIYLRCPIIPGINDEMSHYRAIAELSQKYDAIQQVNLMTYHDMAKGKADQIGEKYELSELKTIEAEQKERICQTVRKCGCLKLTES